MLEPEIKIQLTTLKTLINLFKFDSVISKMIKMMLAFFYESNESSAIFAINSDFYFINIFL